MADQKKICIIDDEPEIREVLSLILSDVFAVTEFESGLTGLADIRAGKFDVVLTDFHMPDVTGLDLVKELRKQSCVVPVIVVSGKDRRDPEMVELLSLNHTYIVSKPFDPRKLRQTIEDILSPKNTDMKAS